MGGFTSPGHPRLCGEAYFGEQVNTNGGPADGIHLRIRLSEAKSCVLVVMGMSADGTKELIAMADGYWESAESWADLLRDSARRGTGAPVLAAGDGALGFWKALAEVFPEARHQRRWIHKTANVLNAPPKSAQPGARREPQDTGRGSTDAIHRRGWAPGLVQGQSDV